MMWLNEQGQVCVCLGVPPTELYYLHNALAQVMATMATDVEQLGDDDRFALLYLHKIQQALMPNEWQLAKAIADHPPAPKAAR
jgi:hypothetical protein